MICGSGSLAWRETFHIHVVKIWNHKCHIRSEYGVGDSIPIGYSLRMLLPVRGKRYWQVYLVFLGARGIKEDRPALAGCSAMVLVEIGTPESTPWVSLSWRIQHYD